MIVTESLPELRCAEIDNSELEEIFSQLGDGRETGFPIFKCHIGDNKFNRLLQLARYGFENLRQTEEENERRMRREIDKDSLNQEERLKDLEMHERFRALIERGLGMDYPSEIIQQIKMGEKYTLKSFEDLPLQVADQHVHAYDFIARQLERIEEPVAIIRCDAHTDCANGLEDKTTRANYVSQLLFDSKFLGKISRVINVGGDRWRYKGYTGKVNGINSSAVNIFDLSEIDEPAIIDIDLDGFENGGENHEFNRGRPGGHAYRHSCLEYYNQENITNHPRAVTRVLRTQVKNPLSIAVALERGFRNRFFWYRVEKDFFESLVE